MKLPSVPQLLYLFLLGGIFLHFLLAAGRTFYRTKADGDDAAAIGEIIFVIGGTAPVWYLGTIQPIPLLNGVIAAFTWLVSLSLYEWARHTIWGRRFGVGWGDRVPEAVCEAGPYRYVRHPLYLAYLLAFLAALIALPHWLTASLFVGNVVLWIHAARHDEKQIADSALASEYSAYRARTPMLLPGFSRSAPGRSTP